MRSPAELVAEQITRCGWTQGEAAQALGVGRCTVNQLTNGRRRITSEMAIRLSRVFPHTTPIAWLYRQANWDLFRERSK